MKFETKWFKFEWLTSKERQKLQEDSKKLEIVATKAIELIDKFNTPPTEEPSFKAYKNLYYSNGTATVVTKTGDVFTRTEVDLQFVELVKRCTDEQQVISLFTVIEKAVVKESNIELATHEEKTLVKDNLFIFRNNTDFEVKDNQVFLRGVSLELPSIVAASFIEILEKSQLYKSAFEGEEL